MATKTPDLPEMTGPGVGLQKIKAVEEAADDYAAARDKRMALTEKEIACKVVLVQVMKKNDVKRYIYDDHEVLMVEGEDGVKVRAYRPGKDDE